MDKALEIRNRGTITRSDIAELLKSIGKPGQKRKEKVEAVASLNLQNTQGYSVQDDLESYKEY